MRIVLRPDSHCFFFLFILQSREYARFMIIKRLLITDVAKIDEDLIFDRMESRPTTIIRWLSIKNLPEFCPKKMLKSVITERAKIINLFIGKSQPLFEISYYAAMDEMCNVYKFICLYVKIKKKKNYWHCLLMSFWIFPTKFLFFGESHSDTRIYVHSVVL